MANSLNYHQAYQDGYYGRSTIDNPNELYWKAYNDGRKRRLLDNYLERKKSKENLAFENEQLYKS